MGWESFIRLCSHYYQRSIQLLIRSKEYTINSISINMAATIEFRISFQGGVQLLYYQVTL